MKIKAILTTACCFFALAGAVTFTACQKDPCTGLTCQNGGSCDDGFCRCQTGYEGVQCETKTADKFIGMFAGNLHCEGSPSVSDTVDIALVAEPDQVSISRRGAMGAGADAVFNGIVRGNDIIVEPIYSGSSRRSIAVYIDPHLGKLTFYDEYKVDTTDPNSTSLCTFYGFKK